MIMANFSQPATEKAAETSIKKHLESSAHKTIFLFPQEQGYYKRIILFKQVFSIDTESGLACEEPVSFEVKNFYYSDGVNRERVVPLQLTFAESNSNVIPIIAYNVTGDATKGKFVQDMAFVLLKDDYGSLDVL